MLLDPQCGVCRRQLINDSLSSLMFLSLSPSPFLSEINLKNVFKKTPALPSVFSSQLITTPFFQLLRPKSSLSLTPCSHMPRELHQRLLSILPSQGIQNPVILTSGPGHHHLSPGRSLSVPLLPFLPLQSLLNTTTEGSCCKLCQTTSVLDSLTSLISQVKPAVLWGVHRSTHLHHPCPHLLKLPLAPSAPATLAAPSAGKALPSDICMVLSLSSSKSLFSCHILRKTHTDTPLQFQRNSTPTPAHTLFFHCT
uniref:Uncharacterized protein n=1 Tax=Myotis myotis TaxID=51298 RepID=A0A7J7Z574_MYOMY|nr:hypothetical protein mMyoMyo1_010698 [Myotis myotis]